MKAISLFVALLKLQSDKWREKIGYGYRFFLCGIFTFLSVSVLKPLGEVVFGKENELIQHMFDNPPFTIIVLYGIALGYIGLYLTVIAGSLYASLLPKK